MAHDEEGVTRRRLLTTAAAGSVPAVAVPGSAAPQGGSDPADASPAGRTRQTRPEPDGPGVMELLVVAGAAAVGGLVGGFVASYLGGDGSTAGAADARPDHSAGGPRSPPRDPVGSGPGEPPEGDRPPAEDLCPACGAPLPATGNYCRECGEPL